MSSDFQKLVFQKVAEKMSQEQRLIRIQEWMGWWAPEVKKRIERGELLFALARDTYELVRKEPTNESLSVTCLNTFYLCRDELDKASPGAYDYLAR
jgi:hypothetical protein